MRIKYLQSGGFSGTTKACELDSTTMDQVEQETVKGLVDQAAVRESTTARSETARDVCVHDIQIEKDGTTHHIVVDDVSIPERLRPLLNFLRKRAKFSRDR